jgi:hypothetical protein
MRRTRAEMQAELEAARLIAALLDWTEQTNAPDLTAIEDEVLKLRQHFGEKLAEAAVERQPTVAPLTVACPPVRPADASEKETPTPVGGQPGRSGGREPSVLLLPPLPGRGFFP